MILPPLRYHRPNSLAEAVSMLGSIEGAAVLAGGQTLLNALKLDLVAPSALVDIHRLPELRGMDVRADGRLIVGAAVTYAELAGDAFVQSHQPALATMAARLVDRQVRNRGTIGGNCCLNDPTSNFPPLLAALDAVFVVAGPAGARRLTALEFFTGTLATALAPDELLTAVEVPPAKIDTRVEHRHLQVAADSWAVARAVVRIDVEDSTVRAARAVLGAVLGSPYRLEGVEAALVGRRVGPALADSAGRAFDQADVPTVDDVHCSADYRRRMSRVQLRRAVAAAVEGSAA
jgi:aerobic carbon-monoxide dehydrogenase medium subunit